MDQIKTLQHIYIYFFLHISADISLFSTLCFFFFVFVFFLFSVLPCASSILVHRGCTSIKHACFIQKCIYSQSWLRPCSSVDDRLSVWPQDSAGVVSREFGDLEPTPVALECTCCYTPSRNYYMNDSQRPEPSYTNFVWWRHKQFPRVFVCNGRSLRYTQKLGCPRVTYWCAEV